MVNIEVTVHFTGNVPAGPLFLLLQNRRIPLEFLSLDTLSCTFGTPHNLSFDMVIIDKENRILGFDGCYQHHICAQTDQSLSYTILDDGE